MLYRQSDGSLIEINRKKYINDTEYYEDIYKYINSISLEKKNIYMENTNTNTNTNENTNDELMGNSNKNIINYIRSNY